MGVAADQVGYWVRTWCMRLARDNNTPVDYWLSFRLRDLCRWIDTNTKFNEEIRQWQKAHKGE